MIARLDRAGRTIRDRVVLDTLLEHPLSSARMLSDRILEETGGPPTIATGALWIPAWTMYGILRRLEERGLVERRAMSTRKIYWLVAPREEEA